MTDASQAPGAPAPVAPAAPVADVQPLIPAVTLPADAPKDFGPREAGRMLAQHRAELRKKATEPEPAQDPAAAQPPAIEGDPAQPAPAEPTEDAPDPAAEPPIEPPRSWTKEAKERFASLPRDTQEYLAQRETERDRDFRRSQNEAAEARKAIDADRQAVTQAKQQYEAAIKTALEFQQSATSNEFADIKSPQDAMKLATDDPFRYARFAAHQQQLQTLQTEAQAAQQRQAQEFSQKWNDFAGKQDALLAEREPEMAKPEKRSALQKLASDYLTDLGFTNEEALAWYNGTVIRDARVQQAILDGARYRQAQKAIRTAPKAPVPPVQRPGVSQPRADVRLAEFDSLNKRLEDATGHNAIKIAAQMRALAMKPGRR